MKKITLVLLFCFVILLSLSETTTYAATSSAKVKEVIDNAILLDDGTLWIKNSSAPSGYFKYRTNAVTVTNVKASSSNSNSLGLTANGELVYWNSKTTPTVDKTQTNIVQLGEFYYLKSDGTVWDTDGQQDKDIKDAVIISGLAHINKKGEIRASSKGDVYGVVDDPKSIVAFKRYDDILAYLDSKGKVVVYDGLDYNSALDKLIRYSVVVTEDAANIDFHESGALIVTKKDGTAWITDPNLTLKDRYKLINQISGIKDAAQVTDYYGTLVYDPYANVQPGDTIINTSGTKVPQWLVKHKDGTWKIYRNNNGHTIEVPTVSGLSLTASNSKPVVGDTISFKTVQTYNNGYQETITDATLTFDKPYLVKEQTNGSYKAVAVGETKVNVTADGTTKSITLSISASSTLNGLISKDNTTYLPMVSVFKALGGTVQIKDGNTFDISLGDTKLQLKTGQKKAMLNGKEITLNQPVQVLNGSNVFPAALLTKASIAKLEWDNKYKKMKISVGKATLTVTSAETAVIEKKEKQGTLAQYINKTYWVNRYGNWERFMKLTVTDIVPVADNNFNIVFKGSNGKTYSIDYLLRDIVSSTLQDQDLFLSYDPYKKYNWTSSTWESIKAEKIKTGMNKAQVELSWGRPNSTSTISSGNITVEVWRYGKQYVSFTNGIVKSIYS